jgi:hypothetical protein
MKDMTPPTAAVSTATIVTDTANIGSIVTFAPQSSSQATTVPISLVIPLPEKRRKSVLNSWHYCGFTTSALMMISGFTWNSLSALMSGISVLIITITSIYELSKG